MSSVETAGPSRSPGAQPVLLALGFVILILISAASIFLTERSREESELVVHTMEVQNRLSLILLNLRRAESAQRGFMITGQTPYRTEYEQAVANTRPAIENARQAIADNAAQSRELDFRRRTSGRQAERNAARDRALRQEQCCRIPGSYAWRRRARPDGRYPQPRAGDDRRRAPPARSKARGFSADQHLSAGCQSRRYGCHPADRCDLGLSRATQQPPTRTSATRIAGGQRQSGSHDCRTDRRPARGQRRDSAFRLYCQPRSAIAAGQHHGFHN